MSNNYQFYIKQQYNIQPEPWNPCVGPYKNRQKPAMIFPAMFTSEFTSVCRLSEWTAN